MAEDFKINNVEEWKEKLTNVVGYQSPIELIMEPLETSITDKAVEVVQRYGFKVDKFELRKALAYDRDQYKKGYADGLAQAKADEIQNARRAQDLTTFLWNRLEDEDYITEQVQDAWFIISQSIMEWFGGDANE